MKSNDLACVYLFNTTCNLFHEKQRFRVPSSDAHGYTPKFECCNLQNLHELQTCMHAWRFSFVSSEEA